MDVISFVRRAMCVSVVCFLLCSIINQVPDVDTGVLLREMFGLQDVITWCERYGINPVGWNE